MQPKSIDDLNNPSFSFETQQIKQNMAVRPNLFNLNRSIKTMREFHSEQNSFLGNHKIINRSRINKFIDPQYASIIKMFSMITYSTLDLKRLIEGMRDQNIFKRYQSVIGISNHITHIFRREYDQQSNFDNGKKMVLSLNNLFGQWFHPFLQKMAVTILNQAINEVSYEAVNIYFSSQTIDFMGLLNILNSTEVQLLLVTLKAFKNKRMIAIMKYFQEQMLKKLGHLVKQNINQRIKITRAILNVIINLPINFMIQQPMRNILFKVLKDILIIFKNSNQFKKQLIAIIQILTNSKLLFQIQNTIYTEGWNEFCITQCHLFKCITIIGNTKVALEDITNRTRLHRIFYNQWSRFVLIYLNIYGFNISLIQTTDIIHNIWGYCSRSIQFLKIFDFKKKVFEPILRIIPINILVKYLIVKEDLISKLPTFYESLDAYTICGLNQIVLQLFFQKQINVQQIKEHQIVHLYFASLQIVSQEQMKIYLLNFRFLIENAFVAHQPLWVFLILQVTNKMTQASIERLKQFAFGQQTHFMIDFFLQLERFKYLLIDKFIKYQAVLAQ